MPTRTLYVSSFLALLAALWCAAASPLRAQALDTVQLRYRFKQGETISYRVIGYDSIVIYDTRWRTLARERVEMVTFRCDSVVPEGFIMTMKTTEYAATEYLDSLPPITRTEHDWVGRSITFLMSPTGSRLDLIAAVDRPGNAPGGPFSPLLLPPLGKEQGFVGSSGAFSNEQWLTDNLYPPVRWKGNVFRVIPERLDTMGHKTVHVNLSEVATVAYQQPGKDNPVTRTTVNGAGDYFIAPKLGYPVGGGYDQIAKFTMEFPNGKKVEGRHLLGMYYELVPEKGAAGKIVPKKAGGKKR